MYFRMVLLLNFIVVFLFVGESAAREKANTNLMAKNGVFNVKKITSIRNQISTTTFKGRQCLETTPSPSSNEKSYVHYNPYILPFVLKTKRLYTASVYFYTPGNSKAKLSIDIYDDQNKHIKTHKSSYQASENGWHKIDISFYATNDNCKICPIFWNEGIVYWNDFNLSFTTVPPLLYFSKTTEGFLNIHGKIDTAYFSDLLPDTELSAKISLKDPLNEKVVFIKQYPLTKHNLSANLDLSKYEFGVYRFEIIIESQDKTVFETKMTYIPGIDCAYKEMESFNKRVNDEVDINIKEAERVVPTKEEQERGFILFNRPEPRWIQPDSLPLPDERIKEFRRKAVPGDYVFFTVALLPIIDLKNVEFSFRSEDNDVLAVQPGMLRYIPQQTNYEYNDQIKKYWILPEVIEDATAMNLRKGLVQQYCLTFKIPQLNKTHYKAECIIKVDGKEETVIPLSLKILPIKLHQPKDMIFGIYPDQIRWTLNKQEYTDEKILEELKDIKEHGYNSFLVTAAPPIVEINFKDDYYKLNTDHLDRILKLFMKAGFNEQPYIISTYALERIMTPKVGLPTPDVTYTPEYKKYVNQFFEQLIKITSNPEYPEAIIMGVDEAGSGEKLQRSIRILETAKKHGFRTACTLFQWTFEYFPEYYDVIDFRMYCNMGFWEFYTPEKANELREDTIKKNDVFWSYGSGCYANTNPLNGPFKNTRQDGCLTENRYMRGIFAYRAKLQGEWSWTFCRWSGSPENDFDYPESGSGEFKDAYIVFPNGNGVGYKNTLQWEALRQGWQDYQALNTLESILCEKENKKSQIIKHELDQRIALIPWRNYTQYPNSKLDDLREWILEKIYELREVTQNEGK